MSRRIEEATMCTHTHRAAKAGVLAATLTVSMAAATLAAHAAVAKQSAAPRTGTTAASGAPKHEAAAPAGAKDWVLKGGAEGTVFRNLTIEGEDRIHVDFDRPAIELDLDPAKAPGLEGGSARDQLVRTTPDLAAPLVGQSAREASPYVGRPWLEEFASGPVARFRPDAEGVERWKLVVVDAKGQAVATFSGNGRPPREIAWDGRSQSGAPVSPGLTYSYVFEAHDRAGNKRNFVGEGFEVSAYRLESPDGPTLLFTGRGVSSATSFGSPTFEQVGSMPPPILLEAASWLNQSDAFTRPIQVAATARTYEQANQLAQSVASALGPMVLGDAARIRIVARVEPDAPADGVLAIGAVK